VLVIARASCAAFAAGVTFVLASATTRVAKADEKMECVQSYEDAQKLKQEGKLRASRAELVKCSSEACPPSLRRDCGPWLREIDDALPSVVLGARSAEGHDLIDVRVLFDGAPLATALDGRAVAVDPGVHVFRFEASGLAPVEERVVVREGQKLRTVQITFAPARPVAPPAPAPQTDLASNGPVGPSRRVPVASYALGGLGVVALSGFAYFALDGLSKKSDLDRCRPSCAPGDVDAAKRSFLVGDVSLAVGVVALGAAAYFFFTRPSDVPEGPSAATSAARVDLGLVRGGAVATVGGSF
jgi:hypothetical protein